MGDDAVVVEAYVDANGRVEDYRILSQPDDAKAVLPQLKNLLIFTTFHPALRWAGQRREQPCCRFRRSALRGSAYNRCSHVSEVASNSSLLNSANLVCPYFRTSRFDRELTSSYTTSGSFICLIYA